MDLTQVYSCSRATYGARFDATREYVSSARFLRRFDRVLQIYNSVCQVFVKTVTANVDLLIIFN